MIQSDTLMKRWWRHAIEPGWRARRLFPAGKLRALEKDIAQSEHRHLGQIRFVIESAMPGRDVRRKQSPRSRALDYFGHLRMWDTRLNTGILLYVCMADRAVEIIADRGIAARVPASEWAEICQSILEQFGRAQWVSGLQDGLKRMDALLTEHFPRTNEPHDNELSDEIIVR